MERPSELLIALFRDAILKLTQMTVLIDLLEILVAATDDVADGREVFFFKAFAAGNPWTKSWAFPRLLAEAGVPLAALQYAKILLEGKAQGAEHDLLEQKKISGDNGDISNGMIYQYRNEMRQMLRFSGSDNV